MSSTAPSVDVIETAHALEALVTWLRDSREPADLSKSALSALARLDRHGPLRITDLADREGLTQPGMTTLVNRLVRQELAERTDDPDDRRAVRVRLTDAGLARLTEYRTARTAVIAARLEQLDPSARDALADATDALRAFVN